MILKGFEYAKSRGFITRLVTNGWWAKDEKTTYQYILEMKQHGLDEINTSVDDFHMEFTTIDNIYRLVKYALKQDMNVAIGTITLKSARYNSENVKSILAEKLGISKEELVKQVHFIEDQPTPVGNASKLFQENRDKFKLDVDKTSIGCSQILSSITLLPNGDIKACCGHAIFQRVRDFLYLANIDQINKGDLRKIIMKEQRNLFYLWMYFRGPKRILEKVTGKKYKLPSLCYGCSLIMNKKLYSKIINYIKDNYFDVLVNEIVLSDNIGKFENLIRKYGLFDKLEETVRKIY